jgi:hypothetical protein
VQEVADAVAERDAKRLERIGLCRDAVSVRIVDAPTLALAVSGHRCRRRSATPAAAGSMS